MFSMHLRHLRYYSIPILSCFKLLGLGDRRAEKTPVEGADMSFLIAQPDLVAVAATDLASIGSRISEANSVAAVQTTEVLAAGADEVSAAVAAAFGAHGQGFQALNAQAEAFHQQFIQALNTGAGLYASTEAANAAATANPWQVLQQDILGAINAPTE